MLIIGERLTSGNASVRQALASRDAGAITDLARRQAEAGANYLDIGAAALGTDEEPEALAWMVDVVQSAVDTPLSLDSQNPSALQRALPLCRRPPILNSFSAMLQEPATLLALISDNPEIAGVVAVCLEKWGDRPSPAERVAIAERLAGQLFDAGVAEEGIIFDPVTLPTSAGPLAQADTLQTISLLRRRFPRSAILCAASNSSFGLSVRRPTNRAWAMRALAAGADVFLCDPLDGKLMHLLLSETSP